MEEQLRNVTQIILLVATFKHQRSRHVVDGKGNMNYVHSA
jgi:hypothetical protein